MKSFTGKSLCFLFCVLLPGLLCADDAYKAAEELFAKARFSLALSAFTKIVEKNPENASAWYRRANCQEQLGRYEEALKDYNRAIQSNKSEFEAYYDKAILLYSTLHRQKEARETLESAAEIGYSRKEDKAPLTRIYILKSHIHAAGKEYEKAVLAVTHALYLNSDPVYFLMRGELRMQIKQFSLAKIDFQKALSLTSVDDDDIKEIRESLQEFIEVCEEEIETWEKEQEAQKTDLESEN